jgi:hypothetical protein
VAGGLLVDRDRGRQPLDGVDVGLVHDAEELACVGGEALHVAALPLGVDRVEGQRRLARARHAREHDEGVARDGEVDVLEVVLARSADDEVLHRRLRRRGPGCVVTAHRRCRRRKRDTVPGAGGVRGFWYTRPTRAAEPPRVAARRSPGLRRRVRHVPRGDDPAMTATIPPHAPAHGTADDPYAGRPHRHHPRRSRPGSSAAARPLLLAMGAIHLLTDSGGLILMLGLDGDLAAPVPRLPLRLPGGAVVGAAWPAEARLRGRRP